VRPACAVVLGVGTLLIAGALAGRGANRSAAVDAPLPAVLPVARGESPAQRFLADATGDSNPAGIRPLRVEIPSIGVDAPIEGIALNAAGELAPPVLAPDAGWYAGSSLPGAIGPSVIAGHVDSLTGPAVFARLRELTPGDTVEVSRSDGRTVRFRVTQVAQYRKDRFPTAAVYGPTPAGALRLITCGGSYDRRGAGYPDNVVVYAVTSGTTV
jgi:LPXTG-site transpeptidase (sortase) family protein